MPKSLLPQLGRRGESGSEPKDTGDWNPNVPPPGPEGAGDGRTELDGGDNAAAKVEAIGSTPTPGRRRTGGEGVSHERTLGVPQAATKGECRFVRLGVGVPKISSGWQVGRLPLRGEGDFNVAGQESFLTGCFRRGVRVGLVWLGITRPLLRVGLRPGLAGTPARTTPLVTPSAMRDLCCRRGRGLYGRKRSSRSHSIPSVALSTTARTSGGAYTRDSLRAFCEAMKTPASIQAAARRDW